MFGEFFFICVPLKHKMSSNMHGLLIIYPYFRLKNIMLKNKKD